MAIPYSQQLQLQYQGFLHGADLKLPPFNHFEVAPNIDCLDQSILQKWEQKLAPSLRIGKRVEFFLQYYIEQHSNYQLLAANTQIFDNKITIGELDFIIKHLPSQTIIHIEQIYKFYLFVPNLDSSPFHCWVGPNLKDYLYLKANKLAQKQLPLLYHPNTQKALENLALDYTSIEQQVCFKAALFLPWQTSIPSHFQLNKQAIAGYWINYQQFYNTIASDDQFYLPIKQNWGCMPNQYPADWCSYKSILPQIEDYMQQQYAPMCWIKRANNTFERCFIVWW